MQRSAWTTILPIGRSRCINASRGGLDRHGGLGLGELLSFCRLPTIGKHAGIWAYDTCDTLSLSVQFISFLLFFNKSTAMWFLCPLSSVVPLLPTQAPTPEVDLMCAAGAPTTKNIMFSAGASVAVISGGYLVYISSIKRSKVDMLVKVLSNRKVPKNPYQSRSPREKRFLPQKRQLLRPANIRSASLSLLQQHWTGTTRSEFSLETLHQTPDKNDLDAPQNEGVITTTRQLQNHSFDS